MKKQISLRHFYTPSPLKAGEEVSLTNDLAARLRTVLRAKEGFRVALFNGNGQLWEAEVLNNRCNSVHVVADITPTAPSVAQMPTRPLTLAYGLPKRDANALILRMGTELGAAAFAPLTLDYTVRSSLNAERANRITQEAAEQCERLTLPTVHAPSTLPALLAQAEAEKTPIFYGAARTGKETLAQTMQTLQLGPQAPITLLIGPEGGFSEAEMALLETCPLAHKVALGPHVLRAETAAAALFGAVHGAA